MPLMIQRRPDSRRASTSPMLSFVDFDLHALLQMVVSRHFSGVEVAVSASFSRASPLRTESVASVRVGDRTAAIRIHECLNRIDTPRDVIEFILGHEMLHLVVPRREIDGRTLSHPPEFWDAEMRLFPQRALAWAWLSEALRPCVKMNKKREATMIRRGWQNHIRRRFPTLEDVCAMKKEAAETLYYL
jgi:hypothetical protein